MYERRFGIRYDISFSVQKPSTDTIAVNPDNTPFRQDDGTLLFRPAGHGALVENLRTGVRTFYEVDDKTTYWTIWNNGGHEPTAAPSRSRGRRTLRIWPTPKPKASAASPRARAWRMSFRLYAK